MESPSSTRRGARSQASASAQKSKQGDGLSRSRNAKNPDRSVLLDITNDSPIVGVAIGGLTPSDSTAKNRVRGKQTPGSGEALLRGQVQTLLQKVEEEAKLVNKIPSGLHPCEILGLQISPAQLVAPTPANSPQILEILAFEGEVVLMPSVAKEDHPMDSQQVVEALKQQDEHLGPCLINRALLFDSPGKSEISDSSTISYQGSGDRAKSSEDDNSSAWSLQVNASIQEEEDEGEEIQDFEVVEDYVEECYREEDKDCYDDLCKVLSKITVEEDMARLPHFTGKHTRFVYNSDDEIEGEEEVGGKAKAVSPSVLLLKGWPVPEGKHLRFPEEEDGE